MTAGQTGTLLLSVLFLERFLKRGIIPRMTELEGNLQGQQDDPLAGIQRPSEGGAAPLS